MLLILLSLIIIILFFSIMKIKKGRLYYIPVVLISLYSFVSGISTLGYIQYDFAQLWSNGGVLIYSFEIISYSIFILLFYFLSTFISEKILGKSKFKNEDLIGIFNSKVMVNFSTYFSIFSLFYLFLHMFVVDFNILWKNDTYLLASSNDALKIVNPFSVFIHKFSLIFSMMCCVVFAILLHMERKKLALIVLIPLSFYIFLRIGTHSRSSVLLLLILSMLLFLSNKKLYKFFIAPSLIFLAFFSLINSLIGRNLSVHGFYALTSFFENVYVGFTNGAALQSIFNIFEGVFILGDGFFYSDYQYPNLYKILSISPFPSFVDGFSEKALNSQLRLHTYVPMGALSELWIFGVEYILFYFFMIFLAIYTLVKASISKKIYVFFIVLILICLASIVQYTYPVRNVMRYYYISFFIGIIFMYFNRFRWGRK